MLNNIRKYVILTLVVVAFFTVLLSYTVMESFESMAKTTQTITFSPECETKELLGSPEHWWIARTLE